ncbi:MAG: hypothetical protein IJN19_04955 [Opitutales bacterium]|nr:hypothetical protein [Opitutales bacterium]
MWETIFSSIVGPFAGAISAFGFNWWYVCRREKVQQRKILYAFYTSLNTIASNIDTFSNNLSANISRKSVFANKLPRERLFFAFDATQLSFIAEREPQFYLMIMLLVSDIKEFSELAKIHAEPSANHGTTDYATHMIKLTNKSVERSEITARIWILQKKIQMVMKNFGSYMRAYYDCADLEEKCQFKTFQNFDEQIEEKTKSDLKTVLLAINAGWKLDFPTPRLLKKKSLDSY